MLEYCDAGNLGDMMEDMMEKRKKRNKKHPEKIKLPEKEAIEILHQVTLGLDLIHEKNIVHRDIKADNIFVDKINKTGKTLYKLGDFGFASNKIPLKSQLGTPMYIAPELFV
jgi:serine/threonine protein kinase